MEIQPRIPQLRTKLSVIALVSVAVLGDCRVARAINIVVDYRYDSNNFFNTPQKRNTLEAAAARYSEIITTSLSAATLANNSTDPRIGFSHPGLGTSFDVSPATSAANDALAGSGAANEYRGPWTIGQDDWILYAGGRSLPNLGVGGTGTGLNFTNVFEDGSSHLNRGFRASGSTSNLPVWGGAITFDNDGSTTWHFDPNTAPPAGSSDLYSTALHEIGHALGLSSSWVEWTTWSSGGFFSGPAAVAAYNDDNGTSLPSLEEVSASNHHWEDGKYESLIFNAADPKYGGTVGPGVLQDLLMEPTANLTSTLRRFELTNVDVAALADIGWSVISPIEEESGDFNEDGTVDAADYVVWRKGLDMVYTPEDYNLWRENFGNSVGSGSGSAGASGSQSAVPEPPGICLICIAGALLLNRRSSAFSMPVLKSDIMRYRK